MSKVFQEIQEAESNALQEIATVKSSLQDSKIATAQKAKNVEDIAKKDADTSFSNKVVILEDDMSKKREEALLSVKKEVEVLSSKADSLISTGVEFLLPRLLNRAS